MTYPNINHAWGALIVEELLRSGVEYFCLSPGSRCAPLTVQIARHPKAKKFVHFDERGLGFHALGYVTATRRPAVLVCTSGTAVANFLPAIVEAAKKKVPLIVLTADRPPELRQTGAVQTIDQPGIFSKYAVSQTDMPCPDLSIKPEFVLTTIDQAVYQSIRKAGVVHINCMFREPLTPVVAKTAWGNYFDGLKNWQSSTKPYTEYTHGTNFIGIPEMKKAAERINGMKSGIIVAGKLGTDADRGAVLNFARKLGWPIFADVSSGLRLGHKDENIIHYYDQTLLSDKLKFKIDGVVHFGGRMTSKRFYEYIDSANPSEYVMVLNHSLRSDPFHRVTLRVEAKVADFCDNVKALVKTRTKTKHLTELIKANSKIDKAIDAHLASQQRLTEPAVARLVSQLLPAQSGLYLSNSMPIRDMDMYADFKGKTVRVDGNRGASGIDGLIASACGYAQAIKAPVTLMIGDLAALHDLNSLAMLKRIDYPIIIVVLNNGGGGIFSFLPIANEKDVFENYFGTPHPYTFSNAAAMFELNYAQPYQAEQFKKAYAQALKSTTTTIIEVMTGREENLKVHKLLQQSIL
jgi:2-succinyl-5-enolpyruvyl-6-hydroxy-3-cyclohexene-1-carboxylate synthase